MTPLQTLAATIEARRGADPDTISRRRRAPSLHRRLVAASARSQSPSSLTLPLTHCPTSPVRNHPPGAKASAVASALSQ